MSRLSSVGGDGIPGRPGGDPPDHLRGAGIRDGVTRVARGLSHHHARLVADGAEAIILGCTEIMLLVQAGDSPVPLFDTTALHAEAAIEIAFGRLNARRAIKPRRGSSGTPRPHGRCHPRRSRCDGERRIGSGQTLSLALPSEHVRPRASAPHKTSRPARP
ncbi:aspartate/glutamate racemase family protein [Methylobacterium brachiatum]|uniref:aspartate/glutamate racemase family protein n=1 Tax=Methylobacterium brachiatum TaxID=269660 RepID=UPI00315C97BB